MTLETQLQRARDLFSVDPALLGLLAVAGEVQRVPAGATLLSEGRVSHVCFLLVEGAVSLRLERPSRTLALRRVEPGEFFGHDALLCRDAQRWSAQSEGPATLLRFDGGTLEATLDRGGPLSTLLHERLAVSSARQLRDANALLLQCDEGAPAAEAETDTVAYVERVARRAGIDPEVLEMRVQAVPDLGPGWKRR
ncbi:MAG: Crp/Fnr family transcriptional regulator [Polyangiales bacterium]